MKKKRIVLTAAAILAALCFAFFIGTGFTKRTDVILTDYSVSEDGTKLTFRTAAASSMGYTRSFKDVGGGVKPHYLTFYSTFGGFNSSLGAKYTFELDLDSNNTEIYFNRAEDGYELVLQKNADTGIWTRP